MALILTDEEQALADSVRRFVADRSPLTSLRQLIASGEPYDPDVWKQMTAQLGLAGLTIPESYGGVGAGYSALSVALTELGAGLVASPLLASVLAAEVLLRLDDEAARTELLPRIAAGELIATLALASEAGGHVTASGSGDRPGAVRQRVPGPQRGRGGRAAGSGARPTAARSSAWSTGRPPG